MGNEDDGNNRAHSEGSIMTTVPLGRLQDTRMAMGAETKARSAYKSVGNNVFSEFIIKTWKTREAMIEACEKSDTGELGINFWKPC
jgi:hypothetical protein